MKKRNVKNEKKKCVEEKWLMETRRKLRERKKLEKAFNH